MEGAKKTDAGRVPALVTGEWVRSRIADGDGRPFKVVDCSWFLVPPAVPHRPVLAGAAYFDVDEVADRSEDKSPSPHMLPSPRQFAAWMDRHGISPTDHVVLYDHSAGLLTASARVWWTFRVFGHNDVSVLEGGYACWPAGVEIPASWRIVPSESTSDSAPAYPAVYHPELVWGQEDVLTHVVQSGEHNRQYILLDARPAERFRGEADEPRRGVPSGSVPGSVSLPFALLFHKVERTNERGEVQAVQMLKSRNELVDLFAQRGVLLARDQQQQEEGKEQAKAVAAMCGSGVTACPLALVLHSFGHTDVPIYDGSWTEWAFSANPKQHLQVLPPDVVPLRKYHH